MTPQTSSIARAVLDADYAKVRAAADAVPEDSPLAPAYQALRKAADAIENIIPPNQAFSALRDVIHRPPEDTELFFLLLGMGIQISTHLGLGAEGRRFSLLMKELLNELRHPEFKAFWLNECHRIHHSLYPGDRAASWDTLNEALSLEISRDTGLGIRLKFNRVLFSLFEMNLATTENDLSELEPLIPRHPQIIARFQYLKALWHQRIGNNNEALRILTNAPPDELYAAGALNLRLWLLSETEQWEEFDRELATLKKSPVPFFKPANDSYFQAWKEYKQGHPEKARELVRETISLTQGQDVFQPNLLLNECIELLVMVELSLRHSKTARRLLDMLDPDMSIVRVATLRMRLFLLEGNETQAAVFLKRILDIGKHGPKFLVRGLRNAPEVAAHQIENLRILASGMASLPAPADAASSEPGPLPALIGESPAIRRVKTLILKYAPLKTTVLITGETGTGKDIVARLIHESGRQPELPFIPVNCASIADTLIEAELFGYVKGAFTGATTDHEGLFVTAGEGTLFLDDIDAMSPQLQAALLRVLENGEVRPVGSTQPQKTHARIIAATNRPLEELIREGTFREDLFYRLARMEIRIPPLRERPEDIAVLARHFLKMIYTPTSEGDPAAEEVPALGENLLQSLKKRPWPGNVRELKNEIERIAILAGDRSALDENLLPGKAEPPAGSFRGTFQPRTQKRRERLRALFAEHPHLTFQETMNALRCSPATAVTDLRALEAGGFIRRVERTSGKRTLYYTRV
ncbi:MAG: sigma-54 dependent transcriptional regulator [Planctomycetota bacterium]